MEVASAASAILFCIITFVQFILGFLVLSYAGYSFLTVFVSTSAGTDEVIWPKDPFQDWILKSWYLVWLSAVWAIPAWLLANVLDSPGWVFALIIGGFLWLMFPIGLLSSLSASSRLIILRPVILGMFVRNILPAVTFYTLSALLLAGCGALSYYAVVGPFYFVPLAAFAAVFSLLISSRVLGRVGWVFAQQMGDGEMDGDDDEEPIGGTPARRPPVGQTEDRDRPPKSSALVKPTRAKPTSTDPWAASLEQALRKGTKPAPIPYSVRGEDAGRGGDGESFELLPEDKPWQKSAPPRKERSVTGQPFSVAPGSEPKRSKYDFDIPGLDDPSGGRRKGQPIRHEVPPPPDWPLWSGVYSFPFYPSTLSAFAVLLIGFLGMFILARTMWEFWPL